MEMETTPAAEFPRGGWRGEMGRPRGCTAQGLYLGRHPASNSLLGEL